jgi:protein-ribulosamine 3-kinase
MSDRSIFAQVEGAIRQSEGIEFSAEKSASVGGGCINSAYRIEGGGRSYFVKMNRRELLSMFEAEADGLTEIMATASVRAPRPICVGIEGDRAFLVLESISMRSARGDCDRKLGEGLAALHVVRQPYFGWHRDNTIGSTAQPNNQSGDWAAFWSQHRLGFQLDLAARQGYGGRLQREGEKLQSRLSALFSGHQAQPSLLHGDLWGGNYSSDETGEPVIYDPATYYGDREADLAMTELFGGFGRDFYDAYRAAYPLDSGYGVRKVLYNLYHILNHLNLFGGGYLGQAESMIATLLAEVR